MCASLAPNGNTKNVSDFPRRWNSKTASGSGRNPRGGSHHRGRSWFFFPTKTGPGLDGYWTMRTSAGNGDDGDDDLESGNMPRPIPPVFYIQGTRTGFSILCVDGGADSVCDPINPGFNGSAWHAANGTLGANLTIRTWYDSENGTKTPGYIYNGTVGEDLDYINWSDGSTWHRSSCACQCIPKDDPFCNQAKCAGSNMSAQLSEVAIRGKPWIVFFHGGAFKYFSGISGNYYAPAARLAKLTGMGVLSVDYRSTDSIPHPTAFPGDLADIVQAMQWLKSKGATELFMFGDSSGGTQVVQTLLWMEHKRQTGEDPGVEVSAAISYSVRHQPLPFTDSLASSCLLFSRMMLSWLVAARAGWT